MAPDWSLVGGDPAPGSVPEVNAVAGTFVTLRDTVGSVSTELARARGASAGWKGRAAEEFRSSIDELPGDLRQVGGSFGSAVTALRRYANELAAAQQAAARTVHVAAAAKDDCDRETRAVQDAQARISGLDVRLAQARRDVLAAELRLTAATASGDAVAVGQARQALAAARARHATIERDLGSARADRDRHSRALHDAERRLSAERDRADRIRRGIREDAARAAQSLRVALEQANLPSLGERTLADVSRWMVANADVFADSFLLGADLFFLAARIPGAQVLFPVALVLGGIGLAINYAVATDGGEVTQEEWLALTGDAMGFLAGAAGFKGLNVAAEALTLGEVGTRSLGVWTTDGGTAAIKTAATGALMWGAGRALSFDLTKGIERLNRDPRIAGKLVILSGSLSQDVTIQGGRLTLSAPSTADALTRNADLRALRSFLGHGYIPPGGFLPGNVASVADILGHHALPREATEAVGDVVSDVVEEGIEAVARPVLTPIVQPVIDEVVEILLDFPTRSTATPDGSAT